jgi:hypothetical protein
MDYEVSAVFTRLECPFNPILVSTESYGRIVAFREAYMRSCLLFFASKRT